MREELIGFYPPDDAELKELWSDGLVVLDTNVLLNLYRYSVSGRNELLDFLEKLKNRLWLPFQVAFEYHNNRASLIFDERKNCDEFIKSFEILLQSLDQTRRHPFISDELQKRLKAIVGELRQEIAADSASLEALRRHDLIRDRLTEIYKGRVGPKPDDATKTAWMSEGEERYRRGIPPGFEDSKKAGERRFGDLFLWMQLLDHARQEKVPVIFVTDDSKKDWWREIHGETVGPHPDLISEVVAATSKPFYMYRPERFIEFAGKHLSQPVSQKVVDEVKEVQTNVNQAVAARRQEAWLQSLGEDLVRQSELQYTLPRLHEAEMAVARQHEIDRLTRTWHDLEAVKQDLERSVRLDGDVDAARVQLEIDRIVRAQFEVEKTLHRERELQSMATGTYEMTALHREREAMQRELEARQRERDAVQRELEARQRGREVMQRELEERQREREAHQRRSQQR